MTATIRPTMRASVADRTRIWPWWLWIVTALAFPPAGFIGHELAGPVDGVGAALLSRVITGALIGPAHRSGPAERHIGDATRQAARWR